MGTEVPGRPENVPAVSWIERLATRDFIPWRARRWIGFVVVAALVGLLGTAFWVVLDPAATPSHNYSREDLAIVALAKSSTGTATDAPDPNVTPQVEPVDYLNVTEDVARRVNAAVPFSTAPIMPARPFILMGTPQEHEEALTCLALAAYYEAGNDAAGQSAVVQVVLNRLRHPAFPKSVCGVVSQGMARSTGCQFTFACDGAMLRRSPSPDALLRARASAERALTGGVFSLVGNATHYHTDWVLPRWSGQMDKITAFHGHLFFRWRGAWGQPAAFRGAYAGPELIDARFARYSSPVASFADASPTTDGIGAANTPAAFVLRPTVTVAGRGVVEASGGVARSDEARHIYYVLFGGNDYPGSYAITAWKICAGKSPCSVYGWRSAAAIPDVVIGGRPGSASFSFTKREGGTQESLWNCKEVARDNAAQCLPGTVASQ